MRELDLVGLTQVMELTEGNPEVVVALVDAPILLGHPDLERARIREIPGALQASCSRASGPACTHGTFVAGMLSARRGSSAPAMCPGCTLLIRPIFAEVHSQTGDMPSASEEDLATAITDVVDAGAWVINVSAAVVNGSSKPERAITQALNYAGKHGVIVVVAAGNEGTIGGSSVVSHPWAIPVAACDLRGRPWEVSNLGHSVGRRGLSAPGYAITSLGTSGDAVTMSGTGAAAPFVTGAIALLWSELPATPVAEMKFAVTRCTRRRPTRVVPPLLDAAAAYHALGEFRRRSIAL